MSEIKVNAKFDYAGSETQKYKRFIFGIPGDKCNGGIYLDKSQPIPEQVIIIFEKGKEDANTKRTD